jgi:DNA-directed RNA polymerase subunit M/transcription elongation factor TFIIS
MSETTKKIKQVCKCENCGNEAEMVVTCSLEDGQSPDDGSPDHGHTHEPVKIKGTATCTSCGNEADMWVDL